MKKYRPIDPKIYDKKYFLKKCTGFDEYKISFGEKLNIRLKKVLNLAEFKPGLEVLDIGCGRGELVVQALKKGCLVVAIDYSKEAIVLTKKALNKLPKNIQKKARIFRLDAKKMQFPKEKFDLVIMADFVEHLYDWELKIVYEKIYKILKPGGRIIIHTAPNKLYIDYTYPILKVLMNILGKDLGDIRMHYPDEHEHVNEHTPAQLKNALKKKFKVKVWSENLHHLTFVNKIPLLNRFTVSIFAVAKKP